eukprot:6135725-Amphidinium_carterae.1
MRMMRFHHTIDPCNSGVDEGNISQLPAQKEGVYGRRPSFSKQLLLLWCRRLMRIAKSSGGLERRSAVRAAPYGQSF